MSILSGSDPYGTFTMEDFERIGNAVRNWGRWGHDDQIGTLNFVTPERLVGAAALIKQGKRFELGIPFDSAGPQTGANGRSNPLHVMTEIGIDQDAPGPARFADDYIVMPLQGASQWDGLAHAFYDGKLYNGFSSEQVTPHGAKVLGIENIGKDVVGRGVLLDVARYKGVEWLEMGEVVTPQDLDATAAAANVEIQPGDILCVRTGWRRKFLADGAEAFGSGEPGLGMACAEWLFEHEIAAVACDNWAVEVVNPIDGIYFGEIEGMVMNLHCVLIRDMGLTLGEILDFEALAEDCATDGVYEFFFCGPPLKVTGAVGSPVNPLAIK